MGAWKITRGRVCVLLKSPAPLLPGNNWQGRRCGEVYDTIEGGLYLREDDGSETFLPWSSIHWIREAD